MLGVLVGVGLVLLGTVTWLLVTVEPAAESAPAGSRRVPATVVQSTPCGRPEARDVVEVPVDGAPRPAVLDGCGHRVGTVLEVEIPEPPPAGRLTARLPGTGSPATGPGPAAQTTAVLAALAGLASAVLVFMLRRSGARPAAAHRYPSAPGGIAGST